MAQMTGSYDMMRRKLRPMGRRLRWSDTLFFASRTFWMATVASAVIAALGHLRPIANLPLWVAAPLAIWLLVLLGNHFLGPCHRAVSLNGSILLLAYAND